MCTLRESPKIHSKNSLTLSRNIYVQAGGSTMSPTVSRMTTSTPTERRHHAQSTMAASFGLDSCSSPRRIKRRTQYTLCHQNGYTRCRSGQPPVCRERPGCRIRFIAPAAGGLFIAIKSPGSLPGLQRAKSLRKTCAACARIARPSVLLIWTSWRLWLI